MQVTNSRIDIALSFFEFLRSEQKDAQVKIDMKCQNKGPIQYIYSESRGRIMLLQFFYIIRVKFAKCHYSTVNTGAPLGPRGGTFTLVLGLAFLGALRDYNSATREKILQMSPSPIRCLIRATIRAAEGPIARKPQIGDSLNLLAANSKVKAKHSEVKAKGPHCLLVPHFVLAAKYIFVYLDFASTRALQNRLRLRRSGESGRCR